MEHTRQEMTLGQKQSRRVFFAGLATSAAGLMMRALPAEARRQEMLNAPAKPENAHRTALHQEISIEATPHRVYDILLDAKKFALFTGAPATIDPNAGGNFSLFGGLVVGRNVELAADELVVQAWRPTHWSAGVYSIARFALQPKGAATMVVLDHTGFPEGEFDHLGWGWNNHYWEPLKKFVS